MHVIYLFDVLYTRTLSQRKNTAPQDVKNKQYCQSKVRKMYIFNIFTINCPINCYLYWTWTPRNKKGSLKIKVPKQNN